MSEAAGRKSTAFRARAEFDIEGEWLAGKDGKGRVENILFSSVRIPPEHIVAIVPEDRRWGSTELEEISRELRVKISPVMEKARSLQYRRRVYG